jgi:hypothetical protein
MKKDEVILPIEKPSPYKYFSYDYEDGFEFHKTQDEAIKRATLLLEYYRDNSGDGWNEDISDLCWGEIKQIATMCNIEPWPGYYGGDEGYEDPDYEPEFEYSCNYELRSPVSIEGYEILETTEITAENSPANNQLTN